jgi:hypothetical protein
MAPLDPKEFRRRLHELAETQGWVHHVANLDTGQLLTFPLDRPVAPLSRAERLSRLGHFFDPSIFGGPRYKLTARTPYQASPKAGLIIRDFPYHPMELREPNSARPDPDHQQRSAHRGPHLHPASSARAGGHSHGFRNRHSVCDVRVHLLRAYVAATDGRHTALTYCYAQPPCPPPWGAHVWGRGRRLHHQSIRKAETGGRKRVLARRCAQCAQRALYR